jgi:hypothetical protein
MTPLLAPRRLHSAVAWTASRTSVGCCKAHMWRAAEIMRCPTEVRTCPGDVRRGGEMRRCRRDKRMRPDAPSAGKMRCGEMRGEVRAGKRGPDMLSCSPGEATCYPRLERAMSLWAECNMRAGHGGSSLPGDQRPSVQNESRTMLAGHGLMWGYSTDPAGAAMR